MPRGVPACPASSHPRAVVPSSPGRAAPSARRPPPARVVVAAPVAPPRASSPCLIVADGNAQRQHKKDASDARGTTTRGVGAKYMATTRAWGRCGG
jgi:hypothetical protein